MRKPILFCAFVTLLRLDQAQGFTSCWLSGCTLMRKIQSSNEAIISNQAVQDATLSEVSTKVEIIEGALGPNSEMSTQITEVSTMINNLVGTFGNITGIYEQNEMDLVATEANIIQNFHYVETKLMENVGAVALELKNRISASETNIRTGMNNFEDNILVEMKATENLLIGNTIDKLFITRRDVIEKIEESEANIIDAIGTSETNVIAAVNTAVETSENNIIDALLPGPGGPGNEIISAIQSSEATVSLAIVTSEMNIKSAIGTSETAIISALETCESDIIDAINTSEGNIENAVGTSETNVINVVNTATGTLENNVISAVNTAVGTSEGNVISSVNTAVGTINTAISTSESNVINAVNTAIGTSDSNIITSIGSTIDTLESSITTAIDTSETEVINAVDNVEDAVGSAETNVISAVNTAVSTSQGIVTSAIESSESNIITAINDICGTGPPSTYVADSDIQEIQIELDIFAGVANPSWTVTHESSEFESVKTSLSGARSTALPSIAGYRGFLVTTIFSYGTVVYQTFGKGGQSTTTLETTLLNSNTGLSSDVNDIAAAGINGFPPPDIGTVEPLNPASLGGNPQCGRTDPCEKPSFDMSGFLSTTDNSYNYAVNFPTGTYAQPGRGGGSTTLDLTPMAVRGSVLLDGGKDEDDQADNEFPDSSRNCLMVLAMIPGIDFIFYRQDADGNWSYKPGPRPPTNLDNSGNIISDPRIADIAPYKYVRFMSVCPRKVSIA